MGDIPIDGMTRVAFVLSISNKSQPTVAELTGGLLLQEIMTPDGLIGYEPDTGDVDTSSLASTFDTKTIGRDKFSGTMLRLKKQTGTDTAYDTLQRGVTGFIVIRRYIAQATSWAAGQRPAVYPIICGQTKELPPERDGIGKYEVPTKINVEPVLRATVV